MTQEQLYQVYSRTSQGSPPVPRASLFSYPALNLDLYEDEHTVVNRLFYVLPLPKAPSLFIFFEDNSFLKDSQGGLALVRSSLGVWHNPS